MCLRGHLSCFLIQQRSVACPCHSPRPARQQSSVSRGSLCLGCGRRVAGRPSGGVRPSGNGYGPATVVVGSSAATVVTVVSGGAPVVVEVVVSTTVVVGPLGASPVVVGVVVEVGSSVAAGAGAVVVVVVVGGDRTAVTWSSAAKVVGVAPTSTLRCDCPP